VKDDILFIDSKPIRLSDFSDIKLIGFGKASIAMGAAVEEALSGWTTEGLLVTNRRPHVRVESEVMIADHPLPDEKSLIAGERVISSLRDCGEKTLIIFLISGGGSALVESLLFDEISLEDLRDLNRILVTCGASIQEVNVIRKRFSAIKGGRLGFLTQRSKRVGLYISDVNQGDLKSLASNPLLPDDSRMEDFFQAIKKYDLMDKLPASIASLIREGKVSELPIWAEGENDLQFNLMLSENSDALSAASEFAIELGYEARVETEYIEGDYKEIADHLIEDLTRLRGAKKKVCLLSGGEASCAVLGRGFGGRNQEFVLYAALRMAEKGIEDAVVLSCGTDGIDGNSIATGAVFSPGAIRMGEKDGLDIESYMRSSDSSSFFLERGGLVGTGHTGNNIRDLRILLAG
jgi:glycerate 2-kinase